MNSMTGFGMAVVSEGQMSIRVELKSVNHRFFDLTMNLPRAFSCLEEDIKKTVRSHVERGALTLFLTIDGGITIGPHVRTNWSVVNQYVESIKEMQERVGSENTIFNALPLLPGVFSMEEAGSDAALKAAPLILQAVEGACRQLSEMRAAEGQHLCADLHEKIAVLKEQRASLARLAPAVHEKHSERLRKHMEQFLNHQAALDEARLLNEVAIFVDKASIDEELTRLDSHLQQLDNFLDPDADAAPVGRKLDFLIQEMNREINTIGAKGNSTAVSQSVVLMKSELEKIREQIQNVE